MQATGITKLLENIDRDIEEEARSLFEREPDSRPEKEPSVNVREEAILQEALADARARTHGSFVENAMISQSLKQTFRAALGWDRLTDVEREALDMIALKFSRILSGKSLERQHWEDCVGYSKLALEQCHR